MLRNYAAATAIYNKTSLVLLQSKAKLHIGNAHHAKNSTSKNQSKVFGKFFGERVSGSKKRWYPTSESSSAQSAIFSVNKIGRAGKNQGKNTTRRMTVLNKLFMKHITDLLATSDVASNIQGRGLQITRVQITADFSLVNVYWMGNGEPVVDMELEKELQRCSGLLRHDLSQLYLMGQVPRIHFVRDRVNMNIAEVEALLRNMDFGEDYVVTDIADEVKRDFHWKPRETNSNIDINKATVSLAENEAVEIPIVPLPEMRHDVLGLDHRNIMFKIFTKMRKSKQAWELHEKGQLLAEDSAPITEIQSTDANSNAPLTSLEHINKQIINAAAVEEKFDKFLAKRRERKLTPERKKYRPSEQLQDVANTNAVLESLERHSYEDDDFIDEDDNEKKS